MKLFQSLLVAPAALGLLAPIAVRSAEFNLGDISRYSNDSVENISNFSELYPSDWSYKALRELVVSRNCSNLIPSGSISRFEAASIINSCLKDFAQITVQERRLIDEFNSELALVRSRVDGLDARLNEVEAGSFSSTTVASFSADFAIGAVNGKTVTVPGGTSTVLAANATGTTDKAGNLNGKNVVVQNPDTTAPAEALGFDYGYQIDLTTSFTGQDSLDISIDAGQGTLSELDLNSGGNGLVVDGIAYTFPLGDKTTVFFGNSMDGSTLFSTACVYGGPTNTLDDCGNLNSALAVGLGTAAGASYDFGNGLTAAVGYEGQGATKAGLGTKEGLDAIAGQIAYSKENFGFSVTIAEIETSSTNDDTFTALNAYFDPMEGGLPSVSVGYEWGDDGSEAENADETTHYFIGLQWDEIGDGTFGIAAGTATPTIENTDELMMYEAWYSYPINDGMTITPLVFTKDQSSGDDLTGVMVKTSFSF
tara:strand:+ start:78 stop:1517 length:1440 start_codon:yes stop_codon:yes gene_type:complete